MKILHLSFSNYYGGANVAAYRIFKSQLFAGTKVDFLVIKKRGNEKNIIKYKYNNLIFRENFRNYFVRFFDIFTKNKELNSYNILPSNIHEYINNSSYDIINLHWINNEMISLKEISKIKKILFWTFHDMWPILGSEHYKIEKKKNLLNVFFKYINFSEFIEFNKQKYFSKTDIKVISPSIWLKKKVLKNKNFKRKEIKVIRNPIDTSFWKITRSIKIKNKIKLLFVAVNPYKDPRKGLLSIFEVLKKLDAEIHIIGADGVSIDLPKNFINLGYVSNKNKLRKIYNSSDALIIPSKQDNLPNVALEAMACGLPIISSSNSGLSEIIIDKFNGKVLKKFDLDNLQKTCNWLKKNREIKKKKFIRNFCINKFSYATISKNYLKFYKEALIEKKNKHNYSNF